MGQDGQGVACAVCFFPSRQQCLPGRIIPQEEDGGFRERPREMGIADCAAGSARAFPRRCMGTRDETARGRKILHAGEARDLMNVREQHEAANFADPRHRLQQLQGVGVVMLGRCDEGEFDVAQERIVVAKKGQIDVNAFLDCRIGTTLGDAIAVGFVGTLFADGRQGILAVGMLSVRQEFAAFAGQGHAATPQVTGGAPLGRVDIGVREHATAQHDRNLMGVDLVVFGFAAVDGLHIKSMAAHKRHPVLGTAVGKPVPRKHTCGGQDDLLTGGRNGFEQRLWGRGHVAVHQGFPGLVENAHVHGASVEIDSAVKRVLGGVESP